MLRLFARVRTFGVATSLAIASLGIVAPVPASASSAWHVRAGNENFAALEGVNHFYPSDITVHPGDTVEFAFDGGHTVTFNPPANLTLFDFLGFNGPVGSSTLDTPKTFVNGAAFFGPGPTPPFDLTIGANLEPGKYAYSCRIHQFMRGVIRVTKGELPSTDAQNQVLAQAQIAADNARAASLHDRLTAAGAQRSGEALVGAGDRAVEFVQFFPSQITIEAGKELTFRQSDLHEPHTVTFGPIAGNPNDLSFGVFPSGPGNPNAYDGTSPLNSGYVFHESQYDYWNIGATPLAAAVPRTEFSVTFTTPGTYNFYCALHGFRDPVSGAVFGMSGSITVVSADD